MQKIVLVSFFVSVMFATAAAFSQQRSLADQIMDADETRFAIIYSKLKEQAEQEVPVLVAEIERKLSEETNEDLKEKLAKRQANAGVALLKLNQPEKVWLLLKHSPDPRARSYLIHRILPLGVDPKILIKRLDVEPDVSIRRALILSLGEFDTSAISFEIFREILSKLQELYRTDSDPGIHAASEWFLSRFHRSDWLNQVNEDWALDRRQRETRLERIESSLSEGDSTPQWYVNGQRQTMVVIPGPVEFLMESPTTEKGRKEPETRHKTRIGRTFSVSARNVTLEQYRRFNKGNQLQEHVRIRTSGLPAADTSNLPAIYTSWYEAVAYCNWLSNEEGIPEGQWCFVIAGNETRLKDNYLSLTGYRLPTEAEIHYAIRAMATTARYYGETDELLPKYAWAGKQWMQGFQDLPHPVGRLKPNDLGLFDAHGNCSTWCQAIRKPFPHEAVEKLNEDQENDQELKIGDQQPVRGGGIGGVESEIRSDYCKYVRLTNQGYGLGFRLARTIRVVPGATSSTP